MHPQIRWVLTRQIATTLVVAVAFGVMLGLHAGVSALFGGGIGVASGYAYVWRAMRATRRGQGSDPNKVFRAQAAGESFKFAATLLLFAVVFKFYGNVAVLPLFLAYVATLVVYWAALLRQH